MNEEEFRLVERVEESHWWFAGRRLLLRAILGATTRPGERWIDLGCGTGSVLRDWAGEVRCVGADRSEIALRMCARRGLNVLARADLDHLPFRPGCFATVLLLDVIEHLPDDAGFLRRARELCEPGGRLVVSVPAFQLLWSRHDVTFAHYRRYSARQLKRVVVEAGLEIERITFTSMFVFPVAAAWRILSHRLGFERFAPRHDFWVLPKWLNGAIARLYAIEAWALRRVDLPFGLSVVCVARNPVAEGAGAGTGALP